jgi:hypothetical protein
VTPLILSAGGAISREDDELLPCPADRNGRHWTRVELSVGGPAQVPVQVGVADVESEGPSRAAGGGLVNRLPVRGLL